ncbi:92_t:CDS:2, partial [Dentiscutata heterogama]
SCNSTGDSLWTLLILLENQKSPQRTTRALLILLVVDSFNYPSGRLFRFWTLLILLDFVILRALSILSVMDSFDYPGGRLFQFWTLLILLDFENQKSPQEPPVILRALLILPVVDSFNYSGGGLFWF